MRRRLRLPEVLRVRLSAVDRAWLVGEAGRRGVGVSEVVRDLLSQARATRDVNEAAVGR